MIETHLDSDSAGQIILSPNMSARWRTNVYFLYIVSFVALTIGITYAMMGLWLVLPYTGIEIIALVSVVYYVARKCYRREVIYFDETMIRIEKGQHSPEFVWERELFWVRLKIIQSKHPWQPKRVFLRARNDLVEVGAFLNEMDKNKLIENLKRLIREA